jgi:hypothetical protein
MIINQSTFEEFRTDCTHVIFETADYTIKSKIAKKN